MILAIALIATALHSTAQAQATGSAATSRPIAAASTDGCESSREAALQCLDKALDGFEKSQKALGFAMDEIEARKRMDALRIEQAAVLRQFIADVQADNDFLRKQVHPSKGKLRKAFETAARIGIFAAGVYVGGIAK